MDHAEALKHLRTLINVASQAYDQDEVQAILREMSGVVNNALPPKPRTKLEALKEPAAPHLRTVK